MQSLPSPITIAALHEAGSRSQRTMPTARLHFPQMSVPSGQLGCQNTPGKIVLESARAHTHTRTHTHINARTHIHTRSHACTQTLARARSHTCAGACALTHTHTHAQTNARIHTRTHTHTHSRVRAHTHTHTRARAHTHSDTHTHTHTLMQYESVNPAKSLGDNQIMHFKCDFCRRPCEHFFSQI